MFRVIVLPGCDLGLTVPMHTYMFVCLSVCLCPSACLSACLLACLSVWSVCSWNIQLRWLSERRQFPALCDLIGRSHCGGVPCQRTCSPAILRVCVYLSPTATSRCTLPCPEVWSEIIYNYTVLSDGNLCSNTI